MMTFAAVVVCRSDTDEFITSCVAISLNSTVTCTKLKPGCSSNSRGVIAVGIGVVRGTIHSSGGGHYETRRVT